MNEFCTCGARLPDDARFCHKCGKPQFELPETVAPPPPVQPAEVPGALAEDPVRITLRNPVAVRVAFLAGAFTALVVFLPLPAFVQVLWQIVMLLGGGFFAVYLYNRSTRSNLTARGGAYLGWIAGLFCFLIMLIMFTVSIVAIATGEGLEPSFREILAARNRSGVPKQFDSLLQSPAGLAFLLTGILGTSFVMITLLPTIGGALGAKVLERD